MTSRLRRKRLTILRQLLTLVSLASFVTFTGIVHAQGTSPAPLAAPRANYKSIDDPNVKAALEQIHSIRERSNKILQVQAQIPDNIRTKRGSGIPLADDDYFFKVETEPPTRERLFTLGSEKEMLDNLEKDFRSRDPNQPFLVPGAYDRFDVVDAPTLGQIWYQNRATGTSESFDRKGEMDILNQRGVFKIDSKPEAAISSETLGDANMQVQLEIALASPASKFGLILRASDPSLMGRADQIQVNSYYFVLVSGNSVELWKHEASEEGDKPPVDTKLAAAKIAEKTSFLLIVTAFEEKFTVYRDGEVILEATDSESKGEYAGIFGQVSIGGPTFFDNFEALRYGGPFEARAFTPTVSVFRGPNVHYNPLRFEQLALERYGHHMGNIFQPVLAHGMFFADVALMPYSMGKQAAWKCHNNEGLYAPGDIVLPFRLHCPIWDHKGVGLQTAVSVLAFSLIP